jgi:asparagine synthase (glutamine-hydrolysing)
MAANTENLENAIVSAVRNGVEDQDIAVAFSGGLDSGLVAAIAKDYARSVTLYTSGKDQSYDVVMAREMSEQLGLPWLHIPITEDNIEARLREMISITATSSPLTLSFELPLFFVCRTVHERLVLGGQGSDEMFAGYSKYIGLSEDELNRARKSDIGKLITSTIPHETKVADHFGKKILYPYLDPLVTMEVSAMDLKDLMPKDADNRKLLLKQVAKNLGYPFIAEKKKKAAQYGSGTMDLVRDVAKQKGMTYSELVESIYKDIFERFAGRNGRRRTACRGTPRRGP